MIVDLERTPQPRLPTGPPVGCTLATFVHLEACVVGHAAPETRLRDTCSRPCLWGGSNRAPKIAACRAIAVSNRSRSVYCGALGVIRRGGDLTLALPIRTGYAVGGELHFHGR